MSIYVGGILLVVYWTIGLLCGYAIGRWDKR